VCGNARMSDPAPAEEDTAGAGGGTAEATDAVAADAGGGGETATAADAGDVAAADTAVAAGGAGAADGAADGAGGGAGDTGDAEGEGAEAPAEEAPPAKKTELTELEIMERITPIELEGVDPKGMKPYFLNSEKFLDYGIIVQKEQDDDIFFSGSQTMPYVVFNRQEKLDEVKKAGFYSDFHGANKEMEKFPLAEMLFIRDYDRVFGENFVWCNSKDTHAEWMEKIQEMRQKVIEEFQESLKKPAKKEKKKVAGEDGEMVEQEEEEEEEFVLEEDDVFVQQQPITPRAWESETQEQTSEEVRLFTVLDSRPLQQMQIQRKRSYFGQPVKFNDAPENIHLCRPQKDPNFGLFRKELEIGIQAIKLYDSVMTQTTWNKPQNAIIQYSADDFIKPKTDEEQHNDVAENKLLEEFLGRVIQSTEEALQQNETIDIFKDEFSNLGDEDFGFGSKAQSNIKEHRNFHDATYTKGKRIEWVEWLPGSSSMLACSCCEALPFSERCDNSGKADISFLLLWSFLDSLAPQTVLTSPWDVSVFKFHPTDNTILVGGLVNGQLAIWQLSAMDLSVESRERKNNDGQITKVPNKMLSYIDDGHKKAVTAIFWLPPCLEIERKGKTTLKKGAENDPFRYILTISGDGQLMIWDFLQAKESMNEPDFQWKPCHRVQLQRQDSGTEMGLCQILYKLPKVVENVEDTGKKVATPIYTNFIASTEEGEVIYGDWAAKAEDDRKPEYCKKMLTPSKTFRPMYTLQRSPFFPDIILGVVDWGFYLWKEGEKEHLYSSPTGQSYFTCGSWSPTRPSVIFLGRLDGGIDIWDFSDQSHKPSVFHPVTSAALSSLVFVPDATDPNAASQLAVGDDQGHLHVLILPKNLVKASKKELSLMQRFIDREIVRVQYFLERKDALVNTKKVEKVEEGDDDPEKEENILQAQYEEFEKWCKDGNLK